MAPVADTDTPTALALIRSAMADGSRRMSEATAE